MKEKGQTKAGLFLLLMLSGFKGILTLVLS
jgi:hypothetical protein